MINNTEFPQNISEENVDEAIHQVREKYGEDALWNIIIMMIFYAANNNIKLPIDNMTTAETTKLPL